MAQCIIPDHVNDNACVGYIITDTINISGALITHDLCAGDFETLPLKTTYSNPGGFLSNAQGYKIVNDNTNNYGFILNRSTNSIARVDYVASLSDTFSIVDIGNPFGLISFPIHKPEFIKNNNIWYGFFPMSTNNIVLYEFANGLNNTPTSGTTITSASFNGTRGIEVLEDSGKVCVISTNTNNGTISVLRFNNGLNNAPDEINLINNLNNVDNSLLPWDISFSKFCNSWVAFIVNQTGELVRLDFGSSLSNQPVKTNFGNLGMIISPLGVHVTNENGKFYCFIQNNYLRVIKIEFGPSPLNTPLSASNATLTDIGDAVGLDVVKNNSECYIFSIGSNTISRLFYNNPCTASDALLEGNMVSFSYTTPGLKHFEITVADTNGNFSFIHDSIFIIESPHADYSSTIKTCINNNILFTNLSSFETIPLSGYLWDFGNSDTSSLFSPSYNYSSSGNYNVSLTVTNLLGCSSSFSKSITVFSPPACNFNVSDICENDSSMVNNLSAAVQGDSIVSYLWDFGNGITSTEVQPSFIYDSAGVYSISLTIYSQSNCQQTLSKQIYVKPKPDFNVNISNTCLGAPTNFANNTAIQNPANITAFSWNFGTGDSSTQQSPAYLYNMAGNYNVSLVAITDNGCSDTLNIDVRISNKPIPDFSFISGQICEEQDLLFSDLSTVSGDTVFSWIWDFGNGDSAFVKNPLYGYQNEGVYTITLLASSGNSCDSSISKTITITNGPDPGFSYMNTCKDQAAFFQDTSIMQNGNINAWQWDIDSSIYIISAVNHTFTDTGAYDINLTVTGSNGCQKSVSHSIIIYKQPLANFYNYWSCDNFNTQIFNSSNLFGNTLASTLWDFGDPASGLSDSSTAGNPLHLFSNAGNHNVQLIITTQNGCVDTVSRIIDTKPAPVANFTTSATCENVPVQFSDISNYQTPYSNYKRTWYFGDNTSIGPNAAGTISHNYSFPPTSYTAILHVISNSGCQDTVSKIINIEKVPNAALGFSHNCPNELTILTNQSSISSGSIQNVIWNIQNQYYTGDTLNLQLGVGTYPITMTVTSDHNCTDDVIKVVTVLPLPVASFSLDSYFGNPPFEVQPQNTSTGATNYFWDFGNTETSTAFEPVITYNDSGHFALSLVAFNSDNCTDTAIRYIDIIPSHLDIAVLSLRVNNKSNYSETIAELANLGTVEVTSMDLVINSDNDIQVKEAWTGSILPGSAITYTLKTSVRLSEESEYLCLSAENINAKTDEKPENNKDCNVLNTNFSLPLPTPNPATSSIKIPVIIPEKSTIKIEVYNSGAAGLLKSELNLQKGINFIELDINEWNSGAYFYRINFNGQWLSKSFIKSQQ